MKDDEHEIARAHMGFPEVSWPFGGVWGVNAGHVILGTVYEAPNWGMARTGVVKRKRPLFQPRVAFQQQHKSLFYITFLDWRYRFQ